MRLFCLVLSLLVVTAFMGCNPPAPPPPPPTTTTTLPVPSPSPSPVPSPSDICQFSLAEAERRRAGPGRDPDRLRQDRRAVQSSHRAYFVLRSVSREGEPSLRRGALRRAGWATLDPRPTGQTGSAPGWSGRRWVHHQNLCGGWLRLHLRPGVHEPAPWGSDPASCSGCGSSLRRGRGWVLRYY
jgi:hypothetical protein